MVKPPNKNETGADCHDKEDLSSAESIFLVLWKEVRVCGLRWMLHWCVCSHMLNVCVCILELSSFGRRSRHLSLSR